MAKERLSYYHILPKPAHTILAHTSLSVLLHLDDEIDRDTIALTPYAAWHWVDSLGMYHHTLGDEAFI